jgi:hypothetical protein
MHENGNGAGAASRDADRPARLASGLVVFSDQDDRRTTSRNLDRVSDGRLSAS